LCTISQAASAPGRAGGIRAVPLAKRGAEQDIMIGHQQSFRRSPPDNQPTPDIMPQASQHGSRLAGQGTGG
jgi:hypothetical protein